MVEIIKELCKEHGMSLHALEKASGIGRGNIARWDEHSPSIDKVMAVADFFGVSLDYLAGKEEKHLINCDSDTLMELLGVLVQLNEEGQDMALSNAKWLASTGKYKKHDKYKMVEGA